MQIFGLLRNHQICGQLAVKRVRLQGILLAALLRVHLCGIVPKLDGVERASKWDATNCRTPIEHVRERKSADCYAFYTSLCMAASAVLLHQTHTTTSQKKYDKVPIPKSRRIMYSIEGSCRVFLQRMNWLESSDLN